MDENGEDIHESDLYKKIMNIDPSIAVVLPVSLHDHGGLRMSVGVKRDWDSGQVGFIYVSMRDMQEKHGFDENYFKEPAHQEWIAGRTLPELAKEILEGEVETYDTYMRGDVYTFTLEAFNVDGELVEEDSCGGFFGSDIKENGMMDHFPRELQEEIEKHSTKTWQYANGVTFAIKTEEFAITPEIRKQVEEKFAEDDIKTIKGLLEQGNDEYLYSILAGECPNVPYSKLTPSEVREEYERRFRNPIEEDFGQNPSLIIDKMVEGDARGLEQN